MSSRTTDRPRAATRSARRRPTGSGVATTAVATFLVIVVLLAVQMAAGNDPALGDGDGAAAPLLAKRPVIHRRIVKTRVVHDPPPVVAAPAAPVAAPAAPAAPVTAAPVTSSPPVAAAPAPAPAAPAPAPAPAPPPPVTSTS